MTRYYNATRGPLAIPLHSGRSAAVPPKQWLEISEEDEGSERVITFLRKGFLVREKAPTVVSTPVAVSTESTSATKVQEELPPEAPVVIAAVEESPKEILENESEKPASSDKTEKSRPRGGFVSRNK